MAPIVPRRQPNSMKNHKPIPAQASPKIMTKTPKAPSAGTDAADPDAAATIIVASHANDKMMNMIKGIYRTRHSHPDLFRS